MNFQLYIVLGCCVLALLYGALTIRSVLSLSAGNARMQEIAAAIQEGARAYLNRQYTAIAIVGAAIFILAFFLFNWNVAIGFLIGALFSGLAGYIGMNVSVRANVRTTEASRSGLAAGLSVAFRSGVDPGTNSLPGDNVDSFRSTFMNYRPGSAATERTAFDRPGWWNDQFFFPSQRNPYPWLPN